MFYRVALDRIGDGGGLATNWENRHFPLSFFIKGAAVQFYHLSATFIVFIVLGITECWIARQWV
jgi:hypothetical protein